MDEDTVVIDYQKQTPEHVAFVEDLVENLEEENLPEEEVLPPMTIEEFQAFANAEDETLKEEMGMEPVADQLAPLPEGELVTWDELEKMEGTSDGGFIPN